MFDPTDVISYSSQNNESRDENDCFSRYVKKAAIGEDQGSTSECHDKIIEIYEGVSYDENYEAFIAEVKADNLSIEKSRRLEELIRIRATLEYLKQKDYK